MYLLRFFCQLWRGGTVPASPAPKAARMRDRYRAQVRAEVKQAALRQLADSGPAGLSVSAIGKELGVSGPALYRYFASRDELLTELVIDAYHDLAGAIRAAIADARSQAPSARLEAAARGYRSWAVAQPHRYRLLFGPPLPGYDAHAQRLVEASQAAMDLLVGVLRELGDRTTAPPSRALARQLAAWTQASALNADPAVALHAVVIWSRLHGLVSLEIAGNFTSMGIDPAQIFEAQLAALTA